MSFGPHRKKGTALGTTTTTTTTTTSTSRCIRPTGGAAPLRHYSPTPQRSVGSCHFTPPREAVQERMRRYAQCIRRRQPPPHRDSSVLALRLPCSGRRDRRTAPQSARIGESVSQTSCVPPHLGKAEAENDDSHTVMYYKGAGTKGNNSRERRTNKHSEALHFSNSLPDDALRNHSSLTGTDSERCHHPHQQQLGGTVECMSDDMDDEHITNPYIRSVLRGAEQRWIPPSLAHAPFDYRDRSQTLTEYRAGDASYLSRRDLVREWKKKMRQSPNTGEKGSQGRMADRDDDDLLEDVRYAIKTPHPMKNINEPNCTIAIAPQAVRSPVTVLSGSRMVTDAAGDSGGCSSEERREYLHVLQSLGRRQGIRESDGALFYDGGDGSSTGTRVSAAVKNNFNFSSRDDDDNDDDDPRAYLYASSESISRPLVKRQGDMGCVKRTETPVVLPISPRNTIITSSSSFSLLESRCMDRVRQSQMVLKRSTDSVETAVSVSLLHQQCAPTFSGGPSVSVPFTSDQGVGATNYLVAPRTNVVDAYGVVWIAQNAGVIDTVRTAPADAASDLKTITHS